MGIVRCVLLLGLVLGSALRADAAVAAGDFAAAVNALNTRSFDDKAEAASQLAGLQHPRVDLVLNALMDGVLYAKRRSNEVVIAEPLEAGGYQLQDAITGADLGAVGRRGAKKISVNNKLRRLLRGLIAGRQLANPDADIRERAVQSMAQAGDPQMRALLAARVNVETDPAVSAAITAALAVFDLDSPDAAVRLAAVNASVSNLHPTVRMKLTAIANDEGASAELRGAAQAVLLELEARVARFQLLETLFLA